MEHDFLICEQTVLLVLYENCMWPSVIWMEEPQRYWDKTGGSSCNSSIFNNISLLLIYMSSHFSAPYLNVLWIFQNIFLFPALIFFNTLTRQLWRGVHLKMSRNILQLQQLVQENVLPLYTNLISLEIFCLLLSCS